jgi:formylmethanofuran dehydrogenase subunit D
LSKARNPVSRSSAANFRFQLTATANAVRHGGIIQRQQRINIVFQPAEELTIQDNAVFDHFSQSGSELALRQSFQTVEITTTETGCQKAPIMFLPRGWFTAVLPPTEEST